MTINGPDALVSMLNIRFGHVYLVDKETTPQIAAGVASLYAARPEAIAAKSLMVSLRLRLMTNGGQAV